MIIHPAWTPVSRLAIGRYVLSKLSRQNLATLGTAAGKHLAAVGSSHSLAETVHLGSVAAAGLIGTLHEYTSCSNNQYARQSKTAAKHSNRP